MPVELDQGDVVKVGTGMHACITSFKACYMHVHSAVNRSRAGMPWELHQGDALRLGNGGLAHVAYCAETRKCVIRASSGRHFDTW